MDFGKFTYPFCYVPHPLVKDAAKSLIDKINSSDELKSLFSEGKMMGTLLAEGPAGSVTLYAFSGLAGGRALVEGFVPPIYDYTSPSGYFRKREEEISLAASSGCAACSEMSRDLQDWLFCQYKVHNALGEEASVKDIFARQGIVPPGGTGECAGPKLLEHAYRNGLKPLAMGEFWYGASPASAVRASGRFYPSCTGKCGPLLSWMMKGLDADSNPLDEGFSNGAEPRIIHMDEFLLVVDKPAGMLSVPGRTKAESLLERLRSMFGEVHSCHRLDMDTSGVMVFARDAKTKTALELQFAGHEVRKTYRARLVAGPSTKRNLKKGASGTVALPLLTDWDDRPRQMVDRVNGKLAVTEYEVLEVLPDGETEVRFTPLTGRTHQLRVHAAHAEGLGRPIKGDRLYGDATEGRLWLHAESITFRHPGTGETVTFKADAPAIL